MADDNPRKGGTGVQLLGSLAVAAIVVAAAIWAVTARLGPTSITEREAAAEQAEEAEEAAEEAQEEAEEKAEGSGGRRRRGRDR
ncbi:MAG TPA: hypothetical protein VK403_04090 [Allosphingosinicella sp.]|nr:hypothetical protein [Allosphingosinicella sp.]